MAKVPLSEFDAMQVLRASWDDTSQNLLVNSGGFLAALLGRKIVVTYPDSVTEVYTFNQGSTTLYALTVIYTTSTKDVLSSVERTT